MKSNIEFQLVCGGCGSLAIKIENPVSASRKAVVHCGECGASRGTLGALRDLAMLPDVHTVTIRQATSKVKYQSELVVMHQELQGLRRKVLLVRRTAPIE